jgi:methionyl-tRNA formyltransferase
MNVENIKIVFMGTPEFAVPSLEILLKNGYNIPAVVTVPDKPQGRGLKLEQSYIKNYAIQNNLRVLQPEKMKDENFINVLSEISPDIIVVVAFRILPKEVYSLARLGAFNLHASLLPAFRGAAPINWAIINGEKETGVTTFFLEDKVDTGNIIIREKISIEPDDTAGEVHDKLMGLGSYVVLETVKRIIKGNIITLKQDNDLASPAPKIFKEDCKIDWTKNASTIHNFIRGLSPYPCAFTKYNGKFIKIYKSSHTDRICSLPPGNILVENENLFVTTSNGLIKILEIQMEGKKRMNTVDFLRGFSFNISDHFETSI